MSAFESYAAVVTDKRQIEMRSFPVPQVSPADAILKVELCGICGSDYHYYTEGEHWPYQLPPQILGHEVVGRIEKIGHEAARKWRVKEGDLVIVESAITCGRCRYCQTGNSSLCSTKQSYGMSASMKNPPHRAESVERLNSGCASQNPLTFFSRADERTPAKPT